MADESLQSLPPAADAPEGVILCLPFEFDDDLELLCCSAPLRSPTGPKHPNEWCTASPDLLFRVPETLRSANPEAYLPRIFNFSPYAPKFFFEVLTVLHPSSAPPDSAAAHGHPPPTADNRLKETMVEDLVGAEMLDAMVEKIWESYASVETFRNMYPERPLLMDNVPAQTLARLFALSAAIIVSSFIFYASSGDFTVRRMGSQPPVIRHPIVYRDYAIMDAVIAMDNQIPILLLKLACDALYEMERPRFAIDFNEFHELGHLFSDEETDTTTTAMDATRLLVYILRRSLGFVTPFHVDNSRWELKDLQETVSWIERHPHKPLIAYIYDSLVGPLDGTNDEKTESSEASDGIPGSTVPDVHDSWEWASPCRMVSASQLRRWGVKFRAEKNGCFKAIRFDEKTSTLSLPVITLQDHTVPFLCNLMAYELTTILGSNHSQHVASFVVFLDYLIDTEEDVKVLAEAGVLRSYVAISNASIAKMLDRLVDAMIVDLTKEHSIIVQQLRRACRRRWGRWWASFWETYWEKKPWLLISVAAATVLLVLTVLQTAYAVRQS